MKHMFDPAAAAEIKARVARVGAGNERQWGTMELAQTLAHCSAGFEMAAGTLRGPRLLIGRLMGWAVKRAALGDDAPMRRNSPAVAGMLIAGERDLETERAQLLATIDRFVAGGPAACTTHPHPFFGPLTPEEWSIQMYKHMDHHLRQFGG